MTSFVSTRLSDLGVEPGGAGLLVLDAILVLLWTALAIHDFAPTRSEKALRLLDIGTAILALIVGSGLILGFLGMLHMEGFLLFHATFLALQFVGAKRDSWKSRLGEAKRALIAMADALVSPMRLLLVRESWRGQRAIESMVILGSLLALLWFLGPAVLGVPFNHDSNTYRLTRVGYWLQESRIGHFETNDPRMNFIGFNTEVVMAWLSSFFRTGYPFASLVQYFAGLMALAGTFSIGRRLGLGRLASAVACTVVLGLPPVALQFFSSQNDLFTAGTLCASLAFFLHAVDTRAEGRKWNWVMFGITAGISVGAKGTVLYWVPGLVAAGLFWIAWFRPRAGGVIRGTLVSLVPFTLLAAAPYVLNLADYGSPFAPREMVELQHRSPNHGRARFVAANLEVYAWQLFDPASNFPFEEVAKPLDTSLAGRLLAKENEHYTGFRQRFANFSGRSRALPNEEIVSTGLAMPVLATAGVLGLIAVLITRRRHAPPSCGLAIALVCFFAVFAALESWTPHKFRYFVLVAPAVALAIAWLLERMGRILGTSLLFALAALQLTSAFHYGYSSQLHGWATVIDPKSCPYFDTRLRAAQIIESLGDEPVRVVVVTMFDRFTAGLLRSGVPHHVRFAGPAAIGAHATNESLLKDMRADFLIVSPEYLRPDRQNVAVASPWGVENAYSTVRLALPGETAPAAIHKVSGLFNDKWTSERFVYSVTNWTSGRVVLRLNNPLAMERHVTIRTSIDVLEVDLGPRQTRDVQISVAHSDSIEGLVSPVFIPSEQSASSDTRRLGIRIEQQ